MVEAVQRIVGYKFKNHQLLWEAFQAPGLTDTAEFKSLPDGNRRLALVGDAALKLALVREMYSKDVHRSPYISISPRIIKWLNLPENMNDICSRAVSNNNLVVLGKQLGLDAFVNKNPSHDMVNPVTMAATVEALIGAVYLESGVESVSGVCRKIGLMPKVKRRHTLPMSTQYSVLKSSQAPVNLEDEHEQDKELKER